ncbi:TetR family transcriptional regulator [Streptomyces sp. NK15101]|uniref:TetR family transcriptional regulator n=1 Tax=Streptomyces sp. NK15101 TaxID=2873261 RepID=UPI001CEC0982|nr:TetR family transcriptional regulator [Streptomyces sp. NK15101]
MPDTALRLFAEKGLHGTSVQDVVRAAMGRRPEGEASADEVALAFAELFIAGIAAR